IELLKSSTQHSSVNDFVVINIPEEDVEPKQIILDPDDQPMWESAKTVAPTPNSTIIQLDIDDNFIINSTHLNMIQENKFDGYLPADPHDHIRKFLVICNMFRYGETQSEAIKLLIFPFSLCDEAKTWFNKLNEESITSWEQMRRGMCRGRKRKNTRRFEAKIEITEDKDSLTHDSLLRYETIIYDLMANYTRGMRKSISIPKLHEYLQAESKVNHETADENLLKVAISDIKSNTCKLTDDSQLSKIYRL
ncbi:reverse transcriptase domain-containing protein, partial [Tanacetum coccineum]